MNICDGEDKEFNKKLYMSYKKIKDLSELNFKDFLGNVVGVLRNNYLNLKEGCSLGFGRGTAKMVGRITSFGFYKNTTTKARKAKCDDYALYGGIKKIIESIGVTGTTSYLTITNISGITGIIYKMLYVDKENDKSYTVTYRKIVNELRKIPDYKNYQTFFLQRNNGTMGYSYEFNPELNKDIADNLLKLLRELINCKNIIVKEKAKDIIKLIDNFNGKSYIIPSYNTYETYLKNIVKWLESINKELGDEGFITEAEAAASPNRGATKTTANRAEAETASTKAAATEGTRRVQGSMNTLLQPINTEANQTNKNKIKALLQNKGTQFSEEKINALTKDDASKLLLALMSTNSRSAPPNLNALLTSLTGKSSEVQNLAVQPSEVNQDALAKLEDKLSSILALLQTQATTQQVKTIDLKESGTKKWYKHILKLLQQAKENIESTTDANILKYFNGDNDIINSVNTLIDNYDETIDEDIKGQVTKENVDAAKQDADVETPKESATQQPRTTEEIKVVEAAAKEAKKLKLKYLKMKFIFDVNELKKIIDEKMSEPIDLLLSLNLNSIVTINNILNDSTKKNLRGGYRKSRKNKRKKRISKLTRRRR